MTQESSLGWDSFVSCATSSAALPCGVALSPCYLMLSGAAPSNRLQALTLQDRQEKSTTRHWTRILQVKLR